ncbi:hypothetical protein Hanom_Chr15g01411271 [Helianthus anomalus]
MIVSFVLLDFSPSLLVRYFKEFERNLCELIIEVWMIHETSLGWTRYTPRIIYLLLLCYF